MIKEICKTSELVQGLKNKHLLVLCKLATRFDKLKGNEYKRYTPDSFRYVYVTQYLANDKLILFYISLIGFLMAFNRKPKQTISLDFEAKHIKGFTEAESLDFVDNLKSVESYWRKKGFKTKLKVLSKYEPLPNFRLTLSTRENFK